MPGTALACHSYRAGWKAQALKEGECLRKVRYLRKYLNKQTAARLLSSVAQ